MANEAPLVPAQGQSIVPRADVQGKMLEKVVMGGDLAALTPAQRFEFVTHICKVLGLRIETRPFEYLTLNNKLVLYARKDCTDQLRFNHKISAEIIDRKMDENLSIYSVTVRAKMPDGRFDDATGSVGITVYQRADKDLGETTGKYVPMKGEALANAIMKAETKAKRRATLSICGLGFLDETEVDSIKQVSAPLADKKASEIQVERIMALIPTEQWDIVRKHYQVESFKDLTEVDAAKIIKDREAAMSTSTLS